MPAEKSNLFIAANDRFFKPNLVAEKAAQLKQSQLKAFYKAIQAIETEFEKNQNDKAKLKAVNDALFNLIKEHNTLLEITEPSFGKSRKWPTIASRGISIYSALSGLLLFATSITTAAIAPIGVAAIYVLAKGFEDISKDEKSVRIATIMVNAKEAILDAMNAPKIETLTIKNNPSSATLDNKLTQINQSKLTKVKKAVFNSTTRDVMGLTGTLLGIYGTLFALGIVASNPIGLVVAGSVAIIGAVSYGIYERYKKQQLTKQKQDIVKRQQTIQQREKALEDVNKKQIKQSFQNTSNDLQSLKKEHHKLAERFQHQEQIIKDLKASNCFLQMENNALLKSSNDVCLNDETDSGHGATVLENKI